MNAYVITGIDGDEVQTTAFVIAASVEDAIAIVVSTGQYVVPMSEDWHALNEHPPTCDAPVEVWRETV